VAGSQDADLVARALAGDRQAFTLLHRRYARGLAAIAAERLRDPEDRADAVQDAFAHAFERLDQLRDPSSFAPWLYAIARNAANQTARRRARLPDAVGDAEVEIASDAAGPDELAELTDLTERLASASAVLSARDATALSLAVTFGFGPAELAVALSVTEGNAKVILHRARRRLRAALDLTEDRMPLP
jgi:RNA polymerase sigma-70 factor (ECF subfamily)